MKNLILSNYESKISTADQLKIFDDLSKKADLPTKLVHGFTMKITLYY
jgi:hypothetical protein